LELVTERNQYVFVELNSKACESLYNFLKTAFNADLFDKH